ncbi:MAG: 16S rRNA (uracil(1498)-N(3))-methyltransferase [Nitrospirales bacterium]|nr:16S rRNA (uracil(1498)-N(3))-methyltransferase [Nitrospirales bacterium]
MNLILLSDRDFTTPDRVRLTGRRLGHALEVLKARTGDSLTVGKINGLMGKGVITGIDRTSLEMEITLDQEPPPPLPVTLILSLPRPKVLRRVLSSVTTMGVKTIYLINSFRVEKSFWQTPFLREDSVREQLILGLEQAKDTVMPQVHLRKLFRPFVEDELPGIIRGTTPLIAHPHGSEPIPCGMSCTVTLAIGPEGGFIPYEVERLKETGFRAVSLGERILTVETAVPALLGRIYA